MNVTPEQKDALTELVNIGVGHAASTLNSLIGHKIRLVVPSIEIIPVQTIIDNPVISGDQSISAVSMAFRGTFNGNAALMFPLESASTLVSVLTDEAPDSPQPEELRSGTLAEVGNILLNGVMGSISNMLSVSLNYSVPSYHESAVAVILGHQQAEAILMAKANFYVDELCIEGNILLFFEIESFRALMKSINMELVI